MPKTPFLVLKKAFSALFLLHTCTAQTHMVQTLSELHLHAQNCPKNVLQLLRWIFREF